MNILMPMGGQGKRFKDAYDLPKPLVKVNGKSLVEMAVKTLDIKGNLIFIILRYDENRFNEELINVLHAVSPDAKIILLEAPTEGAAETCLMAKKYIDNDEELIITNCDQWLDWDSNAFMKFISDNNPDACVTLYDHEDIELNKPSKYCFVEIDENGLDYRDACRLLYVNMIMEGLKEKSMDRNICDVYRGEDVNNFIKFLS